MWAQWWTGAHPRGKPLREPRPRTPSSSLPPHDSSSATFLVRIESLRGCGHGPLLAVCTNNKWVAGRTVMHLAQPSLLAHQYALSTLRSLHHHHLLVCEVRDADNLMKLTMLMIKQATSEVATFRARNFFDANLSALDLLYIRATMQHRQALGTIPKSKLHSSWRSDRA